MARILVKHKITVSDPADNSKTMILAFYAPPDAYTGIETETGVKAPASDKPDEFGDFPACSVEELLSTGTAVRKVVDVLKGGKTYRHKIIVADVKAAAFDNAVKAKTYRGGTIKKVVNPLDDIFS
ncbi:hypothetical protein [Gloeothece verrucosa]|uniref:Uncharacterized protein n=1 Tax=Gloeothece verrucosa (strain PCC 7822) TaxID=497965 RepID=E0U7U2_GLOV7|nr:hypothetical protein [Gloeothece verrucosa]ADN14580.1 hypothetical protein Cyan7822_2609 [Gloeothece verrucosa PCC 7822]ADN14904.1 hypothetical protein Cyan7822_2947 [Gloeothece verrucosa PCC 7822]ADN15219.1 hypothetical protein Cyan7822_3269 [Gloeothece verrucosa PCC 7822]ADN16432.1 hypothetical protein Cyan7822_4522 [Gloeothece verrucosa PCC 7822]